MAHAAEPATVLALARDVFGHAPVAWLLTLPIENMEVGESLSMVTQQGVERAIRKLQELHKACSLEAA
jgi:Ni,Fe-hydrogenase maturation factor